MASSRLYVRGLPPALSETDFKEHFSKKWPVTDIQLKPQRRIGYVGFKDADDAAKAVKYFHKSFIRMSRLHVELAKTASEAPNSTYSSGTRRLLGSSSDSHRNILDNPLKRKRPASSSLTEPHTVPNGPPKDVALPRTKAPPTANTQGAGSADELHVETQHDEVGTEVIPRAPVQAAQDDGPDPQGEGLNNVDAADDDEWMRSRTSRLLGLQDDDSSIAPQGMTAQPVQQHGSESAPRASPSPNAANSPIHTDAAPPVQQPGRGSQDVETEKSTPDQRSKRLFLRNLAYTVKEDDLQSLFRPFGQLAEVKVPLDFKSGASKGFAFVEFGSVEEASAALKSLDGSIFQGRLLHLIPALGKRSTRLDDFAVAQLPLKKRKLIEKKSETAASEFNWNSLYMNADAVISSAAARLGVAKSELLDPTSSGAAVKQAQIETHAIQEAKSFFESHAVDLSSFARSNRDGTALLVKNFKHGTSATELKTLFSQSGEVTRVLMPPGGTIAIVDFPNKVQAKAAFHAFAYRKYKDSVLFLERAPRDLFKAAADASNETPTNEPLTRAPQSAEEFATSNADQDAAHDVMDTTTLFVRNLSFATTNERLQDICKPLDGLVHARVKTRPDPKREGATLSMGFGFLEFRTPDQAKAAFLAMNGYVLDGHELQVKASHKGLDAAAERRRDDRAKRQQLRKSRLIVKNLPFEAGKKDVRALFGSYGQVKAVRLPKKFDNTSRGYAFVDFTTPQQAEKAMDLGRTHLLGRRLVIDYAEGETEDPEKEIEKMQRKVGSQSDHIALQKLTANDRKKFVTGDVEGMDEA